MLSAIFGTIDQSPSHLCFFRRLCNDSFCFSSVGPPLTSSGSVRTVITGTGRSAGGVCWESEYLRA